MAAKRAVAVRLGEDVIAAVDRVAVERGVSRQVVLEEAVRARVGGAAWNVNGAVVDVVEVPGPGAMDIRVGGVVPASGPERAAAFRSLGRGS